MDEYESLSHSKWECKYHVVFIPKCRRKTPVWGAETASRRCLPQAGAAEGKPRRRTPSHAGSRSHDDLDSTKIRGLAGRRMYQRQECDPFGPRLSGEEEKLCRAALLRQTELR